MTWADPRMNKIDAELKLAMQSVPVCGAASTRRMIAQAVAYSVPLTAAWLGWKHKRFLGATLAAVGTSILMFETKPGGFILPSFGPRFDLGSEALTAACGKQEWALRQKISAAIPRTSADTVPGARSR